MFEVWASQIDPGLWMIVARQEDIPANQSETDWSLLGSCRISDALAEEVRRQGYVAYRSSRPFDPAAALEPGMPTGRV